MGQAATKERHGHEDANGGASGSSSKASRSFPSSIDGGALEPQGVYQGVQDYDHNVVKTAIVQRRLMPFYKGADDEDKYQDRPFNTECPICFLYYPSTLNHTRCCAQPICSECFVQMKRPDPNHTNPPSTHPAECPYCTAENFGIVYSKPCLSPTDEAGPSTSSQAASRPPVSHGKRKSFSHTDREVLTVDTVRPDWSEKLLAAQQAVLRRANRRIIMRQVGDRLIPIGVSSSRAGADLPVGSGPGGAIVLREGERFGAFSGDDNGSGSGGRRRSRRAGSGLLGLGMAGQDIEELMLEEAMRLSLLEHEEQQRRQNASSSGPQANTSPTATTSPSQQTTGNGNGVTVARSSSTSRGQPMLGSSPTAERLSQSLRAESSIPVGSPETNAVQPAPRTSSVPSQAPENNTSGPSLSGGASAACAPGLAAPIDFGLRDDVLNELAELIDEPSDEMKQRLEAAKRSKEEAAQAQRQREQSTKQQQQQQEGEAAAFSTASAPGSPSGVGSNRPLNPNNPFRSRLASSSGQGSAPGSPQTQSRSVSGNVS